MRHILVTKFLDISPNSQSRTTQTNRKSNEKMQVDRRQETHLVYGFLTGALIRSSKASFASRVGTVTSWCTSSPSIPSMSKLNSRRTFSCLCAGAVAGLQTRKFTNLPIYQFLPKAFKQEVRKTGQVLVSPLIITWRGPEF